MTDVAHSDGAVLVNVDGALAQAETGAKSAFSPDDFDLSTLVTLSWRVSSFQHGGRRERPRA